MSISLRKINKEPKTRKQSMPEHVELKENELLKREREGAPDSRSSGKNENAREILRRRDLINIESLPHDLTKLHDISFLQSTEKLSD